MSVLDRFSLDGRTAIVTGASSGLGVAIACALAEAGADLVLGARRAKELEETASLVRSTGRDAATVVGDVADPETGERLATAAIDHFGRLDAVVNNAGLGTAVPALKEAPEHFDQVLAVNLSGAYSVARHAAAVMKDGGSVINISSVLALTSGGLPQAAYSASKAGLLGLTRDLAQQWTSRLGIRVNAIVPGFFATEMTDQFPEGYFESQVGDIPAGRGGEGAELAATVVFLASDASSYITGATIPVDGGYLIT